MSQHEQFREDCTVRQPYGATNISGQANVHLGDVIHNHGSPQRSEHDRELFQQLRYHSMNARRAQIVNAESDTCDWIWSTEFVRWLGQPDDRQFWINGSAGSGKSTLMKYLARSPQLQANLPVGMSVWTILNFFFDFRQSDQVANSIEGLLRTVLHQIFSNDGRLATSLSSSALQDGDMTTDALQELLDLALEKSSNNFLILIDGLDEYEGNMRLLLRSIQKWHRATNVKLCVASRPEPVIRGVLEGYVTVKMSDWNSDGIRNFVQESILDCRPYLDQLNLPSLQDILVHKARGLFLWVYLAVNEIADACFAGSTRMEIEEILLSLPKDLELFYERIVGKIPHGRKAEAAILYALVSTARKPPPLKRLHCAVSYLALERDVDGLDPGVTSLDHFDRRMNATMGGLFETVLRRSCLDVGSTDVHSGDEESFLPHASPKKSPLTRLRVRLLHETVRAYARNTGWLETSLPESFSASLPDRMWPRLCFKILRTANNRLDASPPLLKAATGDSKEALALAWSKLVNDIKAPWGPGIIFFSKFMMRYVMQYYLDADDALRRDISFVLRSRSAGLHFLHYSYTTSSSILEDESLTSSTDFVVAGVHHFWLYFYSNTKTIGNMSDEQRDKLVTTILNHYCPCCDVPFITEANLSNFFDSPDPTHPAELLRTCIDFILSFNNSITQAHLRVFLFCRYQSLPGFLSRYITPNKLSCFPELVKDSENPLSAVGGRKPLSDIWRTSARYEIRSGLPIDTPNHENIVENRLKLMQWSWLTFFGVTIDDHDCRLENDLEAIRGPRLEPLPIIDRALYHRAGPSYVFQSRPLAALNSRLGNLECGSYIQRLAFQTISRSDDWTEVWQGLVSRSDDEQQRYCFEGLHRLFEHKKNTGHYPKTNLLSWIEHYGILPFLRSCRECDGDIRVFSKDYAEVISGLDHINQPIVSTAVDVSTLLAHAKTYQLTHNQSMTHGTIDHWGLL